MMGFGLVGGPTEGGGKSVILTPGVSIQPGNYVDSRIFIPSGSQISITGVGVQTVDGSAVDLRAYILDSSGAQKASTTSKGQYFEEGQSVIVGEDDMILRIENNSSSTEVISGFAEYIMEEV